MRPFKNIFLITGLAAAKLSFAAPIYLANSYPQNFGNTYLCNIGLVKVAGKVTREVVAPDPTLNGGDASNNVGYSFENFTYFNISPSRAGQQGPQSLSIASPGLTTYAPFEWIDDQGKHGSFFRFEGSRDYSCVEHRSDKAPYGIHLIDFHWFGHDQSTDCAPQAQTLSWIPTSAVLEVRYNDSRFEIVGRYGLIYSKNYLEDFESGLSFNDTIILKPSDDNSVFSQSVVMALSCHFQGSSRHGYGDRFASEMFLYQSWDSNPEWGSRAQHSEPLKTFKFTE